MVNTPMLAFTKDDTFWQKVSLALPPPLTSVIKIPSALVASWKQRGIRDIILGRAEATGGQMEQ